MMNLRDLSLNRLLQYLLRLAELTGLAILVWAGLRKGAAYLLARRRELLAHRPAFPFVPISDSTQVLPAILPGEGPLADHATPYQRRVADRDIQHELRTHLARQRYLLVCGKRGSGKTREAAMLTKALCDEGATVLVLSHEAWLDVPREYPDSLPVKNLLFFIDDLNFHCSKQALTPLAEKVHFPPQPAFQQRLQETLDWFEQACGEHEIRVVATARNEADEWAKLQYNEEDPLWSRFTLFELPPPEDATVTALLTDLTDTLDLACNPSEFPAMAARNDETMANVITNLRLAASRGHLALDDYRPTLEGSYEECYVRALTLGPAVEPIYDALEVMQDIGIVPHRHLVIPLATRLWGGNFFQRLGRRYHIARTLGQLLTRKILPARNSVVAPRDGQVEGRGRKLDRPFPLDILSKIIIDASRRGPDPLTESLRALAVEAHSSDNPRVAATAATRILQVTPGDPLALLFRANSHLAVNAPNDALADADVVLASNAAPHLLTEAHCVRGRALGQMKEYKEALAEFSTVLEMEPEHISAYLNRATTLLLLDRPHAALREYNKAISAQPNWPEALLARASVRHKVRHHRAAL